MRPPPPKPRRRPALRLEALEDRSVPALIALDTADVTVSATAGQDQGPDVAMRPDGQAFVVAWDAPDASGQGIYFQRYNANWQPAGGVTAVNTFTTGIQSHASVGMDGSGNFVVTWRSQNQASANSGFDIYARRFDSNGTPLDGSEFLVNTATAGVANEDDQDPDVAVNASGRFVITWWGGTTGFFDENVLAKGYAGITVGGSGSPTVAFAETTVNDTASSSDDQTYPAVAIDSAGNFVVVYNSYNQPGGTAGTYEVVAQRMTAAGARNGPEILVNTVTAGDQQSPADVAMDGGGNFVVVWHSGNIDGSGSAVVMQRYNSSGVAQGGNVQVNTGITTGSQLNPHVAAAPVTNGDFVVTWEGEESDADATGTDVYFKKFNSSGGVLIGDTLINTGATAVDDKSQVNAAVAINSAGDFVTPFESGSGASFDVLLRRFGEDPDVAFAAASSAAPESSNASISISRTGASYVLANVSTTVQVTRTGGTATPPGAGQDFTTSFPVPVTFPAGGANSQNLSIAVVNDTLDEPDETIDLQFGTVTNGTATGQTTHTYTIQDDDPPPSISVSNPSVTEGNAGTTNLVFTISLSTASGFAVTGNYATQDGTALAGSDYTARPITPFTIPAGTTSINVTVLVNGDNLYETNETLLLNVSGATNTANTTASGTGTITNDDTPPPVSVNNPSVTEGDSGSVNLVFTISIPAVSGVAVTGSASTANGTATAGPDYTALTNVPFTIPAGQTSTTVTVQANGDTLFEGNETLQLNLTGVTGTSNATASGTGTITDDDAAATIAVVSGNNQSAVTNAAFTNPLVVSVKNAAGNFVQGVTVSFTPPAAGASFTPNPATGTTNASGQASSGTVTANGTAGGPYTVTAQAIGGSSPSTTFSLTNLPPISLSINDVSHSEGNAGTTTYTFTVSLSGNAGPGGVTFDIATANGTATTADGDYVARTLTSQTIPTGQNTYTFDVTVNGDTKNEANETFFVNVTNVTGASVSDGQGQGTIVNDDPLPTLSTDSVAQAEGNSGLTSFTFTVSLSAVSGQTVTVAYQTADGTAVAGSDYTATSGTLTFNPGVTTQSITVQVAGDTVYEPDQTFTVTLSAPTNATIATGTGTGTIQNDDAAPTLAISSPSVVEGSPTVTFTVTRTGATEVPISVGYATADGTAKSTASGPGTPDYTATSGTLNFAASLAATVAQTFTVPIANDGVYEATEQFTASLSGAAGATVATGTGTATITDDDPAPTVSINSVSVAESGGPAVFTVTLTGATALPIAVSYATADGTAVSVAGGPGTPDYTTTTGTLTFNPSASGTQTLTISVPVTNDTTNEAAEQFAVNLSAPTNGATITTGTGTATITDDDPVPTVSVDDVTLPEGNAGTTLFTFTVTLSAASAQTVTVAYQTADGTALAGSDYAATSGVLTFAPGDLTKTVTVQVAGDTVFETDQTFTVDLSAPTNATIADGQGVGTIQNDDAAPTLAINSPTVSESAGTITFTVTRTGATEVPIAVNYATADGTAVSVAGGPGTPDYTATSGTLNFAASLAATVAQTFTVPIANDGVYEATEQFTASLSGATGATIATGTGTATITDDDAAPTLSINSVSVAESGGPAVFTVTLTGATALPIGVSYATADGTAVSVAGGPGTPDYTTTTGTLTFNPSASGTQTLTISVPLTDDTTNEAAEQFAVTLSAPTNGATITTGTGTATVTDDDPLPTLSVNSVSLAEGNAGTTAFTFTVTLSAVSAQTVTVNFATADGTALAGTDYAANSGTLTFNPGDLTKTVTVLVTGDTTYEPDETFTVDLSAPTNATIAAGTGTGTITNDDPLPTVTLSLAGSPFAENGGVATVTATLSNPSSAPVTVTLAFSGTATGTDYTASGTSIVIPAGSTTGSVTLTAVDDTADELDETVIVDVSAVTGGAVATPQQVTATITDDDSPVATADAFTTNEDTPLTITTAALLGNDNAAPGSAVEVVAGPAHGTLTPTAGGFTYAPAADYNGPDAFTYRLRNPAGEVSNTATVTLTVTAVNDAPTFTRGPDQVVPRGAGAQAVPGWATGVSAGPADEAGQTLTFTVTTDNPALFAVQPAVDATGTLTYTPAAFAYGTAAVTVTLKDDGGTANGGADTSAPRTFTVTVNKHLTESRAVNQNEQPLTAVGAGVGGTGTVTVFNPDGSVAYTVTAFPDGAGVRAVTADVTGDGVADVVAGTGPGVPGRVVLINGATRQVVRTLDPFGPGFTGGVFVAAGDVNGDGVADVAVSADVSGGARVVVFDGATGAVLASFLGIEDPGFRGGARVAFGDVNADGVSDLVVAAGMGGGPRVAVFDGKSVRAGAVPAHLVNDFYVFEASLRDGAYVSAGDLNGDGFDDLIFGGGPGGGPRVLAFDSKALFGTPGGQFVPLTNFFADDPNLRAGVRVAVKTLDADRLGDLVTAVPTDTGPVVEVIRGADLGPAGGTETESLDVAGGVPTGVYVG